LRTEKPVRFSVICFRLPARGGYASTSYGLCSLALSSLFKPHREDGGIVVYFLLLSSHLSLGLHTVAATPFISASLHLSGPYRPPTNLSQLHQRCITTGIMAKAGREGKGLGFLIYDL